LHTYSAFGGSAPIAIMTQLTRITAMTDRLKNVSYTVKVSTPQIHSFTSVLTADLHVELS